MSARKKLLNKKNGRKKNNYEWLIETRLFVPVLNH